MAKKNYSGSAPQDRHKPVPKSDQIPAKPIKPPAGIKPVPKPPGSKRELWFDPDEPGL